MNYSNLIRGFMFSAFMTAPALSHQATTGQKYDAYCCNPIAQEGHVAMTGDCAPVPQKSVKAVDGGWEVVLNVGDHPLVTKPHKFFMTYDAAKESTDGQFHACLYPTEDTLRCFYRPVMGF